MTHCGIVKQINKLKKSSVIRRVGPNKGSHWKLLN